MCVRCVLMRVAAVEEMRSITSFFLEETHLALTSFPLSACFRIHITTASQTASRTPPTSTHKPCASLLSKQTLSYQTAMSPCGYILSDCLWHVDLLCLLSSCHHESEHGITGLQNESLSRLWEMVTFVQTDIPCS